MSQQGNPEGVVKGGAAVMNLYLCKKCFNSVCLQCGFSDVKGDHFFAQVELFI